MMDEQQLADELLAAQIGRLVIDLARARARLIAAEQSDTVGDDDDG